MCPDQDLRNKEWNTPVLVKIDGISSMAAPTAHPIAESLTKLELFAFRTWKKYQFGNGRNWQKGEVDLEALFQKNLDWARSGLKVKSTWLWKWMLWCLCSASSCCNIWQSSSLSGRRCQLPAIIQIGSCRKIAKSGVESRSLFQLSARVDTDLNERRCARPTPTKSLVCMSVRQKS